MYVYNAEPLSHQPVTLNEMKSFIVLYRFCSGKRLKQGKYLSSFLQIAACELTDDKWMAGNKSIIQKSLKLCVAVAKMRDPDGCVNKDHITHLRPYALELPSASSLFLPTWPIACCFHVRSEPAIQA